LVGWYVGWLISFSLFFTAAAAAATAATASAATATATASGVHLSLSQFNWGVAGICLMHIYFINRRIHILLLLIYAPSVS
jgi:hypothetical protein